MESKNLEIADLNARQTELYNQFTAENPGRIIKIEFRLGDFRAAYRYYCAKCRTHEAMKCIGYSNGCSASRGNYHSTWAVAYHK